MKDSIAVQKMSKGAEASLEVMLTNAGISIKLFNVSKGPRKIGVA